MKKINFVLFVLIFQFAVCGIAFSQVSESAEAIVESARNNIQADTVSSRSRMVITAKNGSQSERVIDQFSKDDTSGNKRSMIVFQSPATVAGTRFLTIENKGKDNDQWIYLPSLGKVRRIAASEGGGSFMGTDFSYNDISSQDRETSADSHKILREEVVNGINCYVIESTPRDTSYQYSKMVQFIDKTKKQLRKIELYDKKGAQVKLMEILEYKDIQGKNSAVVMKMSTLAAGTSTTIFTDRLEYDKTIPEGVFTVSFLETGKVK